MMDKKVLQNILAPLGLDSAEITPFKNIEDGAEYNVWKIGSEYVLKKAKGNEIAIYSAFFADSPSGAPRFYSSVKFDGEDYFLMEYAPGKDLCKCDRASLKKALDALISLQEKYWDAEGHESSGLSFSESLEHRINRGKYLFDSKLEEAYSCFISAYEKTPKTLCHDDLLPFNILISEDRATLIDWEVAGILPYPTSLARLIAHTEESDAAMFYMTESDKLFAIDYYYENLVAHHGISYEDYRRTLDLFLLYEYCEWIMLGNKYEDADMELFEKYKNKAKEHIKTMSETYSRLSAYNGEHIEFRKIFDTIPEEFDKYRPRYSKELFNALIEYAKIDAGKSVLELGPGTGQATDPILRTGCDYNAIELGEHLFEKMKQKYGRFSNFHIENDDFITHNFGNRKFDMIYSAATIQWIPEEIAFSKTFDLLKPGGTLAMILMRGDYKTPNENLYNEIQKVYSAYYKPETEYTHGSFKYTNAPNYGYVDFEKREFYGKREFTADEYVAYCGTHCDHLVIPEPYKTKFFEGLHNAVSAAGNKVVFNDTYILYLAKKPN